MKITEQVSEFLEEKRKQTRPKRLSPATISQYRFALEGVFLPWCAGEGIKEAAQVTDKAMDRFTDYLEDRDDRPLKAESVRTYVRAARLFLNWASVPKGNYQQPEGNPRDALKGKVLTRQKIDRMEEAAMDERDRLIVRVLADTG